jgi:hypothetical protein
MTSIQNLRNNALGDLLIIGNGHSTKDVDWGRLRKDLWTMGINYQKQPVICNYMVYYDVEVMKWYNEHGKKYGTTLISFKDNACEHTDYTYMVKGVDVFFCDSGCHALQIASNIMNFDNIYLIGYDYYSDNGKLRYYDEKEPSQEDRTRYEKVIFERALHKYAHPQCNHKDLHECTCERSNPFKCGNIFQLNPRSKLDIFNIKPLEVIYA